MNALSWKHRRFYRLWNEECAAWEIYKLRAGWF